MRTSINVGDSEYFASLLYDQIFSVFGFIEIYPESADILIEWIKHSNMEKEMLDEVNANEGNLVYASKYKSFVHFVDTLKHMSLQHEQNVRDKMRIDKIAN